MERGIFFHGSDPSVPSYQPVFPARTMLMVRELEELKGTSLYWADLGGGVLSLTDLECEAGSKPDARGRFWGYLSNEEFIRECTKRGVKVFAVAWIRQGWEYPIEVSEDEGQILALNFTRGLGRRSTWGLREFSQDRYPKLFRRFEEYFPRGLRNSVGEPVKDLLRECTGKNFLGEPIVQGVFTQGEVGGTLYFMCCSNPAWREYLKKAIEMQVNAGAQGIHIDESENPLASLIWGGCYCKDCMGDFRNHLKRLKARGDLPEELGAVDLDKFDYVQYLQDKGINPSQAKDKRQIPLFQEYFQALMYASKRNYGELAQHAKNYGAKKGRKILIAGNFWRLDPHHLPLEPTDHIVFELPLGVDPVPEPELYPTQAGAVFRCAAGWAKGRPVVAVEYTPEALKKSARGGGADLFKLRCADAAAFGGNFMVHYRGWPNSQTTPKEFILPYQRFLADHEDLYSTISGAKLAVAYSFIDYYWLGNGLLEYTADSPAFSFWGFTRAMVRSQLPYDVLPLGDGELVPDTLTLGDLLSYEVIVLPECRTLTPGQARVVKAYLDKGGHLVILEGFGENIDVELRDAILRHQNTIWEEEPVAKLFQKEARSEGRLHLLGLVSRASPIGLQVSCVPPTEKVGLHLHSINPMRTVVHVVNYSYDEKEDRITPMEELGIRVRLNHAVDKASVYTPDEPKGEANLSTDGSIRLSRLGIYSIVLAEKT